MFLISVMLLAMVVVMFVSAALALAPGGLARGQNLQRRHAAERAMRTGLDYAIARIRATPGGEWRAQTARVVQSPGFLVQEGQGQVVGWVQDGQQWSRFRINFNQQDGPDGADGMPDATHPMDVGVGLSVNNLLSNSELPVYPFGTSGVDPQANPRFQLPPHSLLLEVEGGCGSVFLQGGLPVDFSGTPSLAAAESILSVSLGGDQVYDSVASAAGDMNFTVGPSGKVSFDSRGAGGARLRTKTGLNVVNAGGAGALLDSPQGEVRTSNNGNQTGSAQLAPSITRQQESASDSFYRISKSSVPKLDASATTLAGGVYEVDLVAGSPVVKFYEMTYADYKAQRLAGTLTGGTVVTLPSSIQTSVDSKGLVEVKFTTDTTVTEGSAVRDLAVVPSKGAFQEGETPALAGLSVPVGTYMVHLANQIQSDIDGTTSISQVSGQLASYNTAASTSSGLAGVIQALGGGPVGNINVPDGVAIQYQDSGTTLVNINNWSTSWDGLGGSSPYGDGQFQYGALSLAQYIWTQAGSNPAVMSALSGYMGPPPTGFGSGAAPDPNDVVSASSSGGSTSSGLAVKDLKIKLAGGTGSAPGLARAKGIVEQSVTLKGPGNVVLAGKLDGQGGAVLADGDIQLLGNGVDLSAGQSANKINLYSAGNILIDGFAFDDSSSVYNNVNLQGVVYSWGDITINVGKTGSSLPWGDLNLQGAMVAFGGDPASSGSSTQPKQISVVARNSQLTFDPAYLLNLEDSPVDAHSSFVVRAYHQR